MARYTITQTCTLTFTSYIEADSEQEALDEVSNMGDDDWDERDWDVVGEHKVKNIE